MIAIFLWSLFVQVQLPDTTIVARIKTEAFQHSQVMTLAYHLTDASGPRLTNSPGLYRAQQWILSTLNGWGLTNVTLEPWGTFGKGWEVTKDYLAMTTPYYQPLIAYPSAWAKGSGGPFTAELALYAPKDSVEQEGLRGKLKGKLVLFPQSGTIRFPFEAEATRFTDSELVKMAAPPPPPVTGPPQPVRRPMPPRPPVVRRPRMVSPDQFFQQEGVIGMLTSYTNDRDGTVYVDAAGSYQWGDSLGEMRLNLPYEHYRQLQRLLENGERVTLEGDIETRTVRKDSLGYNVIGEIAGTDLKDQLVIIGAHLDSWQSATGATDNGAGVAVMLETLRILKALDVHLRRTVRIVLWSGEEQGILGSTGYVLNHFKKDSVAQSKVSAYYNLDNGSGKIRGVYLQGDTAAGPLFLQWLEPFRDLGATTVTWQNTGGTDHLRFVEAGIPGFQFIQDPLEYDTRTHHSNMDTFDHLSAEDLKQASAILATFVYQTAMQDGMIPRKRKL